MAKRKGAFTGITSAELRAEIKRTIKVLRTAKKRGNTELASTAGERLGAMLTELKKRKKTGKDSKSKVW